MQCSQNGTDILCCFGVILQVLGYIPHQHLDTGHCFFRSVCLIQNIGHYVRQIRIDLLHRLEKLHW